MSGKIQGRGGAVAGKAPEAVQERPSAAGLARGGARPRGCLGRGQAGYTFPLMLVILAALAFGAGRLELSQSYRVKRDKEDELMFRGLEYLRAIRAFQAAPTIEKRYPRKLGELVSDPRMKGRRFIRQLYKDPITGRDFDLIMTPEGTISGVVSSSKGVPLRKVDFEKDLEGFDKASSYAGWRFDAKAKKSAPLANRPGDLLRPGSSSTASSTSSTTGSLTTAPSSTTPSPY